MSNLCWVQATKWVTSDKRYPHSVQHSLQTVSHSMVALSPTLPRVPRPLARAGVVGVGIWRTLKVRNGRHRHRLYVCTSLR